MGAPRPSRKSAHDGTGGPDSRGGRNASPNPGRRQFVRHAPRIFDDLAGVEPLWRTLEAEGVGSPYQRFDWVRAYVESLAAHERFEPRIIVIRDAADRPILLLPFAVRQRRGLRTASIIGGKQANHHLPILAPHAPAPSADAFMALLIALGRQLGIDAYDFVNLPRIWRGRPNPLALPSAEPNPSNAYGLTLGSERRRHAQACARQGRPQETASKGAVSGRARSCGSPRGAKPRRGRPHPRCLLRAEGRPLPGEGPSGRHRTWADARVHPPGLFGGAGGRPPRHRTARAGSRRSHRRDLRHRGR